MQRFYGDRLSKVWDALSVIKETLSARPKLGSAEMNNGAFQHSVNTSLEMMECEFKKLGLTSCLHQVERIRSHLTWLGASYQGVPITVTPESVAKMFNQLGFRLTDDLKGKYMLSLSLQETETYECATPLLAQCVADTFTSIAYDVDEAAKCFALGRSTACVFHLMRCTEAGLQALANELDVAPDENWNTVLRDFDKALESLQARLNANSSQKPDDWKSKERFYSEASALLRNMKNAWRNSVMHMEEKYTMEEAARILSATKACMEFLATNLSLK